MEVRAVKTTATTRAPVTLAAMNRSARRAQAKRTMKAKNAAGRTRVQAEAAAGNDDGGSLYGISTEPTDEDVQIFNKIIQATSWEGIVENVKASANSGELGTGTLGAAYLVFSESKKRGENEATLGVMQNIIQVITQAVLTLKASPAQRCMDDLMSIPISEERKLVDRVEEAYNDGVDSYDIAECLRDFIKNLQVQEMSFDLEMARAKEGGDEWKPQLEKLERLAQERIEAQKRAMNILKLIGAEAPVEPPSVVAPTPANSEQPAADAGFFQDQS